MTLLWKCASMGMSYCWNLRDSCFLVTSDLLYHFSFGVFFFFLFNLLSCTVASSGLLGPSVSERRGGGGGGVGVAVIMPNSLSSVTRRRPLKVLHNRSQTYQSPLKPLRRVPQVSIDPPRLARMLCFESCWPCWSCVAPTYLFFLYPPPPLPVLFLLFLLSGVVKVDLPLNLHLADGVYSSVCTKKKPTRTFLVHCIVAAWRGAGGGTPRPTHLPSMSSAFLI